jgi:outer membrane protein insertion porin family
VTVEERNTIVVNDIWMGLAADADTRGEERPLTAYAGIDAAESNLAGTGITLGGAMGIAQDQLALRVRFLDPSFLGSPMMTSGTLLFNDGQDFFGNDRVFVSDTDPNRNPSFAVAQYQRFGGSLGVGRDLGVPTQLWLNYRLETISADFPTAASHVRGTRGERDREPIDFDVLPGRSILSTLSTTIQHDTRDHPVLPTRGWYATVTADVSLAPLGSEYPYARLDARVSKWWRLPWRHVVRLELFGGAISGDAPFFERYYVGDLSDFRASRLLGLNVERRPSPNFLGTAIGEVRYGDYAAKLSGEYRLPLYRGSRSVYGIDLFGSVGVFSIASKRDLTDPAGGYDGAARAPIDLTANLGFRMDTSAGGFTFAFANALGFIPALGEDR